MITTRKSKRTRTAPVRVAFFIDSLSRAGTESQLLALIRELDRSRVEPSLILLDGETPESRELEPFNCPILRLGVKSFASRKAVSQSVKFISFLRREQIDVLQIFFSDSLYFGAPLAKLAGVPHVLRVRNNLGHFLTPLHRKLGRVYGRIVDLTLTNSTSGKQALIEAERISQRRIVVLENGVDLDRFEGMKPPDTSRSDVVRIGLVGNLRSVKNIDGLIRAAEQIVKVDSRCRFEVAGEGDQRVELEQQIADAKLSNRFQLSGSIANVPEFLSRLDIAVLCSHSEGMSNALLEYMASGRAIVATDVGANERLVHDGEQGLIIPPKDDAAIVSAIRRYLQEPELAVRMGRNARRKVEREFSREAMRLRFEEFYESLMRNGSSEPKA